MGGFVVVSIAIHLLLLAYWLQTSSPQLLPITGAPLSVTVLQSQNVQQDEQTSQVAAESETAKLVHASAETKTVAAQTQTDTLLITKEQVVVTAPGPHPQANKSNTTMVAETAAIANSSTVPQTVVQLEQAKAKQPSQRQADNENKTKASMSLAQVREQLRGELNENFAHHFHYPRLARKRGWQGEGLLNLKIESDGTISRILLTKSTGYSLLDDTAINTVMKIRNIKKVGQWLNGRSIEMELPVIYRLTKN